MYIGSPVVSLVAPSPIIGVLNKSVTIQFNITMDNPKVTPDDIEWLFNGTLIQEDGQKVFFSSTKLLITINNLTLSDEGVYTLIAGNPAGTDRADAFLDIKGILKITN